MSLQEPQFIYMLLVLPSLFGLTLVGDGIKRVVHEEAGGSFNLILGVIFIVVVVLAYLFFFIILP